MTVVLCPSIDVVHNEHGLPSSDSAVVAAQEKYVLQTWYIAWHTTEHDLYTYSHHHVDLRLASRSWTISQSCWNDMNILALMQSLMSMR
jgi:hypothetical protein